jgi:hypothetical protein
MLRCKKSLAGPPHPTYVVQRSKTVSTVFLLLGRFLPKLGGAARHRHFFRRVY